MYSLKKVLPTLDNIRTELKQSIGYWQQGSSSQSSPSYEVCLHTLWGESKSADGETRCSPQQDQIPSHGQGVESWGYTVVYTDETYVHTSHVVPKCCQDSTTGLKIPFSKGNLRIVVLHDPWVCTIITILVRPPVSSSCKCS